MKRIGAWLCCVCCAAPGVAADNPAKTGHLTESTEVLVVEVPVQVLRNGEPVRGLTAGDFELWEGREKQTITGFEVLDLAAAGPAAPQTGPKTVVPPSARRRFLLLFDLSFSDPLSIGKAREAARSLVSGGLRAVSCTTTSTTSPRPWRRCSTATASPTSSPTNRRGPGATARTAACASS